MDEKSLLEDHRVERRNAAKNALREATEAVAKARDAVVAVAKKWATESCVEGLDLLIATQSLREAERVEGEARARLEALR
ncbi:MAG: hypothetical protein MUF00_01525 [Gemmatimonadaceae bacterium]|jgi:hypothetical protein|nr:hypothetical protein [Gemmatimonadaceae bacterium]